MKTCRICLKEKQTLAYTAAPVDICQKCIDKLNSAPEPAKYSEQRIGGLLRTGMRKRNPNFTESEYLHALPGWINRLLANKLNNGRDFINVRAYRRGLLRHDGLRQWSYPADWMERARRIRSRDQCCQNCGEINIPLDVHHIIYLSNYGTNQEKNLIALCRSCHEEVHGREFDFGEPEEPGNPNPIRPSTQHKPPKFLEEAQPIQATCVADLGKAVPPPTETMTTSATQSAQQKTALAPVTQHGYHQDIVGITHSIPLVDLTCPNCQKELTAKLTTAILENQNARCPSCLLFFRASDGVIKKEQKQNLPTHQPNAISQGLNPPRSTKNNKKLEEYSIFIAYILFFLLIVILLGAIVGAVLSW